MGIKFSIPLVIVGALSVMPSEIFASSIHEGTRQAIRFEETFPPPLVPIVVEARLNSSQDRLETLIVFVGDREIVIPKSAYADLCKPRLQTLAVSHGPQVPESDQRYVVVEFYFGDPITPEPFDEDRENRDRYSSVQITLMGDRATSRMIFRAEDGGSSKFEEL